MKASDIPRVHTPQGGWTGEMPGPFLVACTEPVIDNAPDIAGTWRAAHVTMNGAEAPRTLPIWNHVERIEQAGPRVTITSDGIIHDFPIVDGTFENGCHDVAVVDKSTPIVVAASYEDGALVLRPQGLDGVTVRRWRDGEHLYWDYHDVFSMRLERID